MSLGRKSRLRLLLAFVALFTLGGDIVADSISDARGDHCVSQTSQSDSHHEKSPCSHCSCAVHNGSVVVSTSVENVACDLRPSGFIISSELPAPVGLPAAIDHPPQLA